MKVKLTLILLFILVVHVKANFNLITPTKNLQSSSLSFLKETNGPLPIEKVVYMYKEGKFELHDDNFVNFARTYQRYWMHFNLLANTENETVMLYFDNPHIYRLKVYEMINEQLVQLYDHGSMEPFADRSFLYRNFVFELHLAKKQKTDYFVLLDRVDEVLKFSTMLYEKPDFMRTYHLNYWFYGCFSGILLFIILFSAFLWLSLNEKIHLWYILYLFLILLFVLADSGLGYEFIWGNYPDLNKHIRTPLGMLTFTVQLQFMQLFISQSKANSRFFIWVNSNKWLFLTLSILYIAAIYFKINLSLYLFKVFQFSFYLAYVFAVILVFLSLLEKIRHKNRIALIYLFAVLTLLAQVAIVMMARWHLIHTAIDTAFTLTCCVLVEVIVLTLGLTFRYNYYKIEKNKLEMNLIAQKNSTLNKVMVAIDAEKKRIAQDLHDDVGGTLSVIKGMLSNIDQPDASQFHQKLMQAQHLLDQACKDVRFIAHDLMPVAFNHSTLSREVEDTVHKANLASTTTQFTYMINGEERAMDKGIELNIFRMINEIIHNIKKHAMAHKALIQLSYYPDFFQLMVEDDGCGFDLQSITHHGIGFNNLKSRAEYMNAEIHIESSKNGTTIICILAYQ